VKGPQIKTRKGWKALPQISADRYVTPSLYTVYM
jgi:hypothetical protein